MDYILSDKSTDLTKYIYNIEWNYTKQHSFGGVPERLIGAVLKTVERASVPWVRIPPPPNKEQIGLSICFLFRESFGILKWVTSEIVAKMTFLSIQ